MRKRWFAMCLAGMMTVMTALTGCGTDGGKEESDSAQQSGAETGQSSEESQEDVSDTDAGEEPFEMVMSYIHPGTIPKDLQMVEDALNEITIPEINVKVTLYPISIGEHQSKYNMMISSGEKLDLICVLFDGGPGIYVNKGQLLELDELFEKYGADVEAAEGVAMAGGYFNGKLYAIPDEEFMGRRYGFVGRQDILDKYEFDEYEDATYEDLDAFFARVKAGEGEDFYIFNNVGGVSTIGNFMLTDKLGASTASGVLMNGGRDDTQITNLYATEEYKEHLKWMRKWYEAGYFPKDCITMTDSQVDLMRSGHYLGCFNSVSPIMDSLCTQDYGYLMKSIYITDIYAATELYQISQWGLPITCENPEKTMEFVNLMFKDVNVANLLRYGIEDVHWVKTDKEGIITFPEGLDANTCGYVNTLGLYGDKSRIYQWEPAEPEIFEDLREYNAQILNSADKQSKALGYCFNTEPVQAEYAAVSTVVGQYVPALETGSVNPDVVLPEFLEALEAAGIQECIAENQKQLNQWLEAR